MKKVLLTALAALAIVAGVSSSSASASDGITNAAGNGPGVFKRLMELERRKNERLRQIFR